MSKARPIQVYLEEGEHRRLEAWARARRWTKSQAVRAAIRALTRPEGDDDPLLELSGMVADDDLPADAAERFDDCLAATFVAEASPRYGRATPEPPRSGRRQDERGRAKRVRR